MYADLWSESYEHNEPGRSEAVLGAAHRLLAAEGGEPEVVLAAAVIATIPKELRSGLLKRHVKTDLHAEIIGILDGDPQNKNAAVVHDALLLSQFNKNVWSGDLSYLETLVPLFKTKTGQKEAKHYYAEREHDTNGSLRPGAKPLIDSQSVDLHAAEENINAGINKHSIVVDQNKAQKLTSSLPEQKNTPSQHDGLQNGAAEKAYHWADQAALRIIQKNGNKSLYTVAAGITPSGVVHIGNFREIITQDLVAKALQNQGKKVRFIYSWDDYDTFRKVPKNIPDQEAMKKYLFQPAVDVPDPYECKHESYADHFKAEIQEDLPLVGIFPEFLHQHKKYRACEYAEDIREALQKKDEIRAILNEFKTEDMGEDWWPVLVYCQQCNRDRTVTITSYDGQYALSYSCQCGYSNTFDLRKTGIAKLPWRVDWPMRWRKEKVLFESAGKEHSSAGGSFDSGKELVEKVFHFPMVEHFMYEFISIKGQKGKMSSSLGNTITLREMLKIYTSEVVRFLFAGTRPSTTFDISFDIDVFKVYEDFDKVERIYFDAEDVSSEKEKENARRIYELSILAVPSHLPVQPSFRHLTNYVQIAEGDIDKVVSMLRHEIKTPIDESRIRNRALCAWNWSQMYAPDQYTFKLEQEPYKVEMTEQVRDALKELGIVLAQQDETELFELFYQLCTKHGIQNNEFFRCAYLTLIGKERGPKLANIITQAGHERIASILKKL